MSFTASWFLKGSCSATVLSPRLLPLSVTASAVAQSMRWRGRAAQIGEFVQPADWWLPLRIGFLSFSHPGRVFLARSWLP
jgi:hypothetical protein